MQLSKEYLQSIQGCIFIFAGQEFYISIIENEEIIISSFQDNVKSVYLTTEYLSYALQFSMTYVSEYSEDKLPFFEVYPINV